MGLRRRWKEECELHLRGVGGEWDIGRGLRRMILLGFGTCFSHCLLFSDILFLLCVSYTSFSFEMAWSVFVFCVV